MCTCLCDSYDTQHINTVWLCRCIIWMSIYVYTNPRFLDSKSNLFLMCGSCQLVCSHQGGDAVGVMCLCVMGLQDITRAYRWLPW